MSISRHCRTAVGKYVILRWDLALHGLASVRRLTLFVLLLAGCSTDPSPEAGDDSADSAICGSQDAVASSFSFECHKPEDRETVHGFRWTGSGCEMIRGCACSGSDCDELFLDQTDCLTFHGKCTGDVCAAQDATASSFSFECATPADKNTVHGFRWTGTACEAVRGCDCSGPDCRELFQDQSDCLSFHTKCVGSGICKSQDATASSFSFECAMPEDKNTLHGFRWNGSGCEVVRGCDCTGADCGELFVDQSACLSFHTQCFGGETCESQDASGSSFSFECDKPEDRDTVHGFRWTGSGCETVRGCRCSGSDCDELFVDQKACLSLHGECGGPVCQPQDAAASSFSFECTTPEDKNTVHGFRWTGSGCETVRGCTCSGSDCDELFVDQAACLGFHTSC